MFTGKGDGDGDDDGDGDGDGDDGDRRGTCSDNIDITYLAFLLNSRT